MGAACAARTQHDRSEEGRTKRACAAVWLVRPPKGYVLVEGAVSPPPLEPPRRKPECRAQDLRRSRSATSFLRSRVPAVARTVQPDSPNAGVGHARGTILAPTSAGRSTESTLRCLPRHICLPGAGGRTLRCGRGLTPCVRHAHARVTHSRHAGSFTSRRRAARPIRPAPVFLARTQILLPRCRTQLRRGLCATLPT